MGSQGGIQFLTKEDVDAINLKVLNTNERYNVWKRIPKVELHCHLEACFSLEFFLKVFRENNINPDFSDGKIIDYYLVKERAPSLDAFVTKTRRLLDIFINYNVLKELGKHAVYKKHREGIVLIELRFSPAYIAQKYGLEFDKILKALKEGINEAVEELNNTISVGLICVGEAGISRESLKECADFCIKNKQDFIGFDNAGYEVNLEPYKDIYKELTNNNIPLSIHAGEDKLQPNLDGVYAAIDVLKAKRIGHGIRISESDDLMKLVKEKNILLEICPLSNIFINTVSSVSNHPVRKFFDNGVKVSISTDDPGLFLKDINDEYDVLYTDLNFNLKDFIKMNYWALEHSFISDDVKAKLKEKFFAGFDFL